MKLVRNAGGERVIDRLHAYVGPMGSLDVLTPTLSLFAFASLQRELRELAGARIILPPESEDLCLLGSTADRAARNSLLARAHARRLLDWLTQGRADFRRARSRVPQGAFIVRDTDSRAIHALLGSTSFSTEGLGIAP